MNSSSRPAAQRALLLAALLPVAALLPACEIRSPVENVDLRLNVPDARVDVSGLGALAVVAGQATQRTATLSGAGAIGSLDAVHAIRLAPSFLTFRAAAGDAATAAEPSASGTVLLALRTGGRPLLAAVATIADGVVTGIDPAVATLATAVEKIREHGAIAAQQVPGAGALLGDWQTLTPATLLATFESILASPQYSLTLVVLPLTGNLSGSITLNEFVVDATVTARR